MIKITHEQRNNYREQERGAPSPKRFQHRWGIQMQEGALYISGLTRQCQLERERAIRTYVQVLTSSVPLKSE